jgi:hypothetical protein
MKEYNNVNNLIKAVNAGETEAKLTIPDHGKDDEDQNFDEFILLSKFLKTNPPLKVLDISGNKIDLTTARSLFTAIAKNKSLESLNLKDMNLKNAGTSWVSGSLSRNKSLKFLDISHNKFGDDGANIIASTLYYNKSLQWIDISNNKFNIQLGRKINNLVGLNTPVGKAWQHGILQGVCESAGLRREGSKDITSLITPFLSKTEAQQASRVCKDAYDKGNEFGKFAKNEIIRRAAFDGVNSKSGII